MSGAASTRVGNELGEGEEGTDCVGGCCQYSGGWQ